MCALFLMKIQFAGENVKSANVENLLKIQFERILMKTVLVFSNEFDDFMYKQLSQCYASPDKYELEHVQRASKFNEGKH